MIAAWVRGSLGCGSADCCLVGLALSGIHSGSGLGLGALIKFNPHGLYGMFKGLGQKKLKKNVGTSPRHKKHRSNI